MSYKDAAIYCLQSYHVLNQVFDNSKSQGKEVLIPIKYRPYKSFNYNKKEAANIHTWHQHKNICAEVKVKFCQREERKRKYPR